MAPRDLTNAQLSSRLGYNAGPAPDFLRKLQARVSGRADSPSDEDEPSYDDYAEYQTGEGGRPPIPRRPPPPRRPRDQPGSDDERGKEAAQGEDAKEELDEDDADDERPQVVVLKEGKHLSEREAENERRKTKGLPPLPEHTGSIDPHSAATSGTGKQSNTTTGPPAGFTFGKSTKRKAAKDVSTEGKDALGAGASVPRKKPKKAEKKLLSFGDDA